MPLHFPKATLLHTALVSISQELITLDNIILFPARLPTELILIIRAHLLAALTDQLFLQSTRALAEYEQDLQGLLCPDCISYNHDIYGPDVWQWQQFSGPCNCIQTSHDNPSKPSTNPQQFISPYHWLEHHLSLRAASLFPASSPAPSIWDVVTDVLRLHHCEPLRDSLDDFTAVHRTFLSPTSINVFYHRRVIDYYGSFRQPQSPPVVRIQPLQSSLRLLESKGIGEEGEAGDTYRAEIILRQASQELGFALGLTDVFTSPREPPSPPLSWPSRKHDASSDLPTHNSTLLHFSTSPFFHGAIKTYSFLSAVFEAFLSMPMTIATLALTVICFYSRPIALRVGV